MVRARGCGSQKPSQMKAKTFSWKNNGDLDLFAGVGYTYDSAHPHAVNTVGGVDRFDYNLNGSMSARNKNTASSQVLRWDSRNQLTQVTWGNPVRNEYYGYDENGRRIAVAAVQNGVTTVTYYPFAHYEQKVSGGSAGVTKYYFFGGERFAMRTGSGAGVLRLLFKDRISSTMHVTDGAGNQVANAGYFPFGATMRSTGTMPTDHLFTDQQQDGSGLYYYGARYYDPSLGHFISPDTIVPDPANVMDYQRYMYVRGNPLKYNDPSGYCATLENGEPDLENDSHCWGLAQSIAGFGRNLPDTFAAQWRITPEQWLINIAPQPFADSDYLQPFAAQYYQEWGRQVGLPVDPVKWHEPVNPPVKLLGQDAAQAVVDDIAACQNNMPLGCGNLLDDASFAIAGSAVIVCAAASGGGCLTVGGYFSGGVSFVSSTFTTINALQGDATTADVIISWSTLAVGTRYGAVGKGLLGTGVSAVQRIYDWWAGEQ